jgi:hypothetical protein
MLRSVHLVILYFNLFASTGLALPFSFTVLTKTLRRLHVKFKPSFLYHD